MQSAFKQLLLSARLIKCRWQWVRRRSYSLVYMWRCLCGDSYDHLYLQVIGHVILGNCLIDKKIDAFLLFSGSFTFPHFGLDRREKNSLFDWECEQFTLICDEILWFDRSCVWVSIRLTIYIDWWMIFHDIDPTMHAIVYISSIIKRQIMKIAYAQSNINR